MNTAQAWRPYVIGKRLLWGGLLLFLPGVPLLALGVARLGVTTEPAAVAAFTWIGLWAVNGLWLSRFACPRCGKRFFIHGPRGVGNLWASACCHCGASPKDAA